MKDPIVCEARRPGEDLAREVNYDLHKFFEVIRERTKQWKAISRR